MKSSVRLGDLIEFSTRKTSSDSQPSQDYISTDSMFPNLGGVGFGISNLPKGKVRRFREGEVLFSNIRTHFRKVWFANRSGGCSNDVLVLRPKGERLLPRYLYCIVSSKSFIAHTVATSKGSKMPRGDTSAMLQYECYLPSIAEQSTIASILGALDDKIDLNRRMNETLEAMARAIFKSWFVDFDPVRAKAEGKQPFGLDADTAALFPDRLVDSEIGPIPEGWEVGSVADIGATVTGKTPPKKDPENYGDQYPFLKIPDMHGKVWAISTSTLLSAVGHATQPKKLVPVGSVAVSCIATPGLVVLIREPTHTNQQINTVVPREEGTSFWTYLVLSSLGELIRARASGGSVLANLNKGQFNELPLLLPCMNARQRLTSRVAPLFEQIASNDIESRTLAELRDLLLPKLLSGEIRVKDAEKMVEDAV